MSEVPGSINSSAGNDTEVAELQNYQEKLSNLDKVIIVDTITDLPFDFETLPSEVKQYFNPIRDHNQKFVVIVDSLSNKAKGFVVLDFPNDVKDRRCEFSYRYVFPNFRQKGIGKFLRREAYDYLSKEQFEIVESGINQVLRITPTGAQEINDPQVDGTWISYRSLASEPLSNGKFPRHTIDLVFVNDDGSVDISFATDLQNLSDQSTLPSTPQELLELLKRDSLPSVNETQLLADAQGSGSIYRNGMELDIAEIKFKSRS